MTRTKTLKRTLTLLLTLSMLLCCASAFGSVEASAATDRVSMYLRDPFFNENGLTASDVYVQTKDNASSQQVYVHYFYMPGYEWKDSQATYVTTLSDGSKIWKASIGSYNTEYAIKYIADGETYWDNNNGNNYTTQLLGTAPITVNRTEYISSYCPVKVTLQNYAYQKNVVARYTDDNWATYHDVSLTYSSTNTDGTEIWNTNIPINEGESTSFEYCVYYEVNGQTFWANNFGQNYDYSHIIHH